MRTAFDRTPLEGEVRAFLEAKLVDLPLFLRTAPGDERFRAGHEAARFATRIGTPPLGRRVTSGSAAMGCVVSSVRMGLLREGRENELSLHEGEAIADADPRAWPRTGCRPPWGSSSRPTLRIVLGNESVRLGEVIGPAPCCMP